jgi:hypothetical protein
MRYCGRDFNEDEFTWIRKTIADQPELTRKDLSILFCRTFNWFKPDGGTKDMSCRVAMLRMEKDGHFTLPPPRTKHTAPYKKIRTLWTLEQPEINKKAGEFRLELELVDKSGSALWNEFIDRYHFCQSRGADSRPSGVWSRSLENGPPRYAYRLGQGNEKEEPAPGCQ